MPLKVYSLTLAVIGLFLLVLYIFKKIKEKSFSVYEIFIYTLAFFAVLSTFTAINKENALLGKINRYEGLFCILTYYLIALNTSKIEKKKQKKAIIIFILGIGLINVFYGILQLKIIDVTSFISIKNPTYYASGFIGNSNFYGSLLSICYPIVLGLFLREKNIKKWFLFLGLLLIFSIGNLLSGAMAVFVADILLFAIILIEIIIKLFKNHSKENRFLLYKFILAIIIFVLSVFFINLKTNSLVKDIGKLSNEAVSSAKLEVNESFGTGRILIWKNSLEKIKENFILGVGIDNFREAFDSKLIVSGAIADKAHNEYLQIMVCEGVPCGIIYIVFLLFIFKNNINNKEKIYYICFLGFTSYCIQAFFSISVTRVAPIFFIIMGLLIEKDNAFLQLKNMSK